MLGSLDLAIKFSDLFAREWTTGGKLASRAGSVAAALSFLVVAWLVFGFTVDDALITARYAANLHAGHGYRLNPTGPVSDGVTPLGFAHLLTPLASSTEAAFETAKALGVACCAAAIVLTSAALRGESPRDARPLTRALAFLPILVLALSPQLVAWSVSGMETGVVTLLVALGVTLRLRAKRAALQWLGVLALGAAAAWRPELCPAVGVLAVAPLAPDPTAPNRGPPSDDAELAPAQRTDARAVWIATLRVLLALTPLACVTISRLTIFGAATPLSAIAKRADVDRGIAYAGASLVLVGAVQLVSFALVRDARGRWLGLAFVVHAAAVALAGGDWMALSRLFVPMLPVLALAAQRAALRAPWPLTLLRSTLAMACVLFAWNAVGWNLGRVGPHRAALVAAMRGPLTPSRTIAAVDIGWPALAAPHATIVDLAGVTDEEVARLPGPHTQKRIPEGFIDRRAVDAMLFNLPCDAVIPSDWTRAPFVHGVEHLVAREHGTREVFEPTYVHRERPCYVVLTRKPGAARPPKPASGF